MATYRWVLLAAGALAFFLGLALGVVDVGCGAVFAGSGIDHNVCGDRLQTQGTLAWGLVLVGAVSVLVAAWAIKPEAGSRSV